MSQTFNKGFVDIHQTGGKNVLQQLEIASMGTEPAWNFQFQYTILLQVNAFDRYVAMDYKILENEDLKSNV